MISRKFIYLLFFLVSTLSFLYLTYRLNHVSIFMFREQYGKQWINEMENKYQKERRRIQKVCEKYDIPRQKIIDKEFIHIVRNHKIALCSHAKVGSTTWRHHFTNLLPNNKNVKTFSTWLRKDNFTLKEYDFAGGHNQWISPSEINNFLRRDKYLSVTMTK